MNNEWIRRRHNSARYFRSGHRPPNTNKKLHFVRMLDAAGMFETGWLVYDHLLPHYGYPK